MKDDKFLLIFLLYLNEYVVVFLLLCFIHVSFCIMKCMKNVLILTSIKTGSGHRSSSNAIEKKLIDAGYNTRQLDVFPLLGKVGDFMENSYIPLTTRAPMVYYGMQRISEYFPAFVHTQMYFRLKENLLKEIRDFKPDLIISVQCMFTQAISRILKKNKMKIPFYVGVIDLIDPPSVWRDKNADMTFVPTEAIRNDYLERGFKKDKVLVSGFPVRDDIIVSEEPKKIGDTVKILMVNTSTDLKKNIAFLNNVCKLRNISVDFICGLDEHLHKKLIAMKRKGDIPDFVRIHGFVHNMNEFMANSHIILTKAGPNVIIESVRSGTAIVITGHIHGQEDNNYRYVLTHGYGLRCEDPERIYDVLDDFIHTGRLKKCLDNIAKHEIPNGAEYIANYVKLHI